MAGILKEALLSESAPVELAREFGVGRRMVKDSFEAEVAMSWARMLREEDLSTQFTPVSRAKSKAASAAQPEPGSDSERVGNYIFT